MGSLLLTAIAITEVHQMVGATDAVAERVRPAAAALLPAEPTRRPGLLSRLRGRPEPAADAGFTADDLDTVLAGRYPQPERAEACIRALAAMVEGQAWGTHTLALTPRGMEDFDFSLARAGVASAVGLERLVESDAGFGTAPTTELRICAIDHHQVEAVRAQLAGVELTEPDQAAVLAGLAEFFDHYPAWTSAAESAGRPAPELVGFWQPG